MRKHRRAWWRKTFGSGSFKYRGEDSWREFAGLPRRWKPFAKSTY